MRGSVLLSTTLSLALVLVLVSLLGGCEQALDVTVSGQTAGTHPEFNVQLRSLTKDDTLRRDSVRVMELYLRQLGFKNPATAYAISYSVSAGDGELRLSPRLPGLVLRPGDQATVVYDSLVNDRLVLTYKPFTYAAGEVTVSVSVTDPQKRVRQASYRYFTSGKGGSTPVSSTSAPHPEFNVQLRSLTKDDTLRRDSVRVMELYLRQLGKPNPATAYTITYRVEAVRPVMNDGELRLSQVRGAASGLVLRPGDETVVVYDSLIDDRVRLTYRPYSYAAGPVILQVSVMDPAGKTRAGSYAYYSSGQSAGITPVASSSVIAEFNLQLRALDAGDTLRGTQRSLEIYLRQTPALTQQEQPSAVYQLSYTVSGGDGDLVIGSDTLRPQDVRQLSYSTLSRNRTLARFIPYKPRPGSSTITVQAVDALNRQRTASQTFIVK